MTAETFDQAKVPGYKSTLFHFKVLHEGWEMDNDAWVVELANGERCIVTSSHGGTYIADREEFHAKLAEYDRVAADTRKALEMAGETDFIARNKEHFRVEGCTARLVGLEIKDCPYTPAAPDDPAFGFRPAVEWIKGWRKQDEALAK